MVLMLSHRIRGNREWWGLWPTIYLWKEVAVASSAASPMYVCKLSIAKSFNFPWECQNPMTFFNMNFPNF